MDTEQINKLIEQAKKSMAVISERLNANLTTLRSLSPVVSHAMDISSVRIVAARERAMAERHLEAEVYRVRTELGLPNHPYQYQPYISRCADMEFVDGVWVGCRGVRGAHPE